MGRDVEPGVRALAQNFGRPVANHWRRAGWSQEQLAYNAEISPGMVAKIETGVTGVRFPMIARIAQALDVDSAELFYSQFPRGKLSQGKRREMRPPCSRTCVHHLSGLNIKAGDRERKERSSIDCRIF